MAKKKGVNAKGGGKKSSKKGDDATTATASSSSRGGSSSRAEKNAAKRGNTKRGGKSKSNHPYSSSSSSDDDDTQFRNQLLNQGHLIREMNSDGNCLFRSLSDQLYNDHGDEHGTVRNEICNHLEQHKDEFQSFLLMNEGDEDVMNMNDYVEHMREHTTWGSDIEIVAACRRYNVGIKVFSTHYGVLRFGNHEGKNNDKASEVSDLLLSYHGNDHYNSVHPIDGSNRQKRRCALQTTQKSAKSSPTAVLEEKEAEEKDTHKTQSTTTTHDNNIKKRRVLPKGSACPCGSGLTYKKCCLAREKAKKRLAKLKNNNNGDDDNNNNDHSSGGDEKKEEFIGEFKVLNI
jgi:hypothetical protein